MGQNNSVEQQNTYNSKDYFNQQVQFYRWRADSKINTHICKVTFHLQDSVRDREKLQLLLQRQFAERRFISLNQILSLAEENINQPKEQLMSFETYVCTLSDLEERLNLEQTLYSLSCLFSGFEVLLGKMGRLRPKLKNCFLTSEGQVRAWMNKDFKSNQNSDESNQVLGNSAAISSEIALIKKILEFGQKLSSNPTQFLHFSRQFRSYMERDILQNWTFINARKLINSYIYTYRLNLPNSLKSFLKKREKLLLTTSISSQGYESQPSCSNGSSCGPNKSQFMSTGDQFGMHQHEFVCPNNTSHMNKETLQRPASLSEISSKKSEEQAQSSKTHSKKFTSTDLKHMSQHRGKQYQSPKMIQSDMAPQNTKNEIRHKRKELTFFQNSFVDSNHKSRKQRDFTMMEDYGQKYNNTTQLTPTENKDSRQSIKGNNKNNDSKQNTSPSILKQHQFFKQKKKLQKKAAAVSKYISFYQESKQQSKNDFSAPDIAVDVVRESGESKVDSIEKIKENKIGNLFPTFLSPQQGKLCLQKRQISIQQDYSLPTYSTPVSRKPSFDQIPSSGSFIMPFKGKTENARDFGKQKNVKDQGDRGSLQHRDCVTIKTINKLLDNNEVSIHESDGSFMSIPESQKSQYKGLLSKMGRSVDIVNLPSNKFVPLVKKPITTSHHLQKNHGNY